MFFNILPFDNIDYYDRHYDSSANLLYIDTNKLNVFDLLFKFEKTHPIERSIEYATMLLKRNQKGDVKRASDILNTVVTFQDSNKQHKSFGTIASFAEVPISANSSQEQEFEFPTNGMICIVLLQILEYFSHLLSSELIGKIKTTCYNFAFQIAFVPHSTRMPISHIQLSYIYILLKCSKMFDNSDFLTYASIIFDNFYSGISYNGGFWEYNSSSETYYTSELLSAIKENFTNPHYKDMADSLFDLLWKNIAENFHSKMKLLTGPQSDISKEMPADQFYTFIRIALGYTDNIPETWVPVLSRCPIKYRFHFFNKRPDKFIQQLISQGSTNFAFYNSKIVTNYIKPNFAVGSFNCCEFWTHHKPIVGYFTKKDSADNFTFGIKVLLNGHDFSSGKLNSIQHNGNILGHISFLTNRGDQHLSFTQNKGIIKTNDFRIRFFVEGNIKKLHVLCSNTSLKIIYEDTVINYNIPFIEVGKLPIRFDLKTKKDRLYFDAIIVEDTKEHEINLFNLDTAVCQFSLQAASSKEELNESIYSISDRKITGILCTDGYELKLVSSTKPDYYEYINSNDRQYINGAPFNSHTTINNFRTSLYSFMSLPQKSKSLSDDNLAELEKISEISINSLHSYINSLLDKLMRENYTLGIFKHYCVQIVKSLFNNAIDKNFQFEDIINNRYFDIYQRISNSPSHDAVCAIILDACDNIVKELFLSEHREKKQNIVSNIISIIEKNYHDPELSLASLSETLGVSESYISRVFKKKTNVSYTRYMTRVRIEKAKTLLSDGKEVEEIALICGYLNLSAFSRSFKKYTGITVRAWLEQNKTDWH